MNTPRYLAQCENLDKPGLKCNGKCQLAKMMSEENQDQPQQKKESRFELFYACLLPPAEFLSLPDFNKISYPSLAPSKTKDAILAVFKPPTA